MIYEFMGEFHLSKMQILREIYIREVPLIIYRLRMKQQNKKLEKLYDNLLNLRIATATAGLGANPEMIRELVDGLEKAIHEIVPNEPEKEPEEPEDPYKKLERLQGIIARTQARKRR